MPISPGQIINNRYRIIKLLGEGGFGAVYQAWDTNLDEPVALKESFETSPSAQKQFQLEAKLLFRLVHPNLPRVHDYFVLPGQGMYLVMDFIEGEDLGTMLRRTGGPLPEEQVLNWIGQVCDALNYLHTQRPPIIHRDIKPANIRICPDGKVMLVDFGIAKVYDPNSSTTVGARAISPGYSPQEQYGRGVTDARTDIYALGATLYTLLTGTEPPESIQRNLDVNLTSPRALNSAISSKTEAIILKAMEMHPSQRFQNASEVKASLNPNILPSGSNLVSVQSTDSREPAKLSADTISIQSTDLNPQTGQLKRASSTSKERLKSRSRLEILVGLGMLGLVGLVILGFAFWGFLRLANNPENTISPKLAERMPTNPVHQTATSVNPATDTPIDLKTDTPANSFNMTPSNIIPDTPTPKVADTPATIVAEKAQILELFFCDRACDDPKAIRVNNFPEKTSVVYFAYMYTGMKKGTHYSRTWSLDGEEWVRYDCVWEGPEAGQQNLKLWESNGLHSGTWIVTIQIENQSRFVETIHIDGHFDYWDPAGNLPCKDW
jgi:serine/threonine protein kinase